MTITGYLRAAGGSIKTEAGWARVLVLGPWRVGMDGEIRTAGLRILLPPGREQDQDGTPELAEGMLVRIELTGLEAPDDDRSWNGVGALDVRHAVPDEALEAVQRSLQEPVVLSDIVLGQLTLERRFNWFKGQCRLPGLACEVALERTAADEDRESDRRDLAVGREAVLMLEARLPELRDAVAKDLQRIWNESWRDGRAKIGHAEIAAGLKLTTVQLSSSRHTLWLDAGDLFDGHGVEVRLSPSGHLKEVCLVG